MIVDARAQNYTVNRSWSDQFIPQIKSIVGPLLLEESSFEIDTEQAADLVVFEAKNLTIACRVRRPGYLQYVREFTIRAKLDNGYRTELQKITDGWGDWMFYGHADEDGCICAYMVIDLRAFRAHMIRNGGNVKSGMKSNWDGTHFAYFDVTSFPPEPPLIIDTNLKL